MRKLIALVAVVLTLAACGGDQRDDSASSAPPPEAPPTFEEWLIENVPPCVDVFAAGRPTADVLAQFDTAACTDPAGDLFVSAVVFWDCADGTTVHVVDTYGWGRDGDVWQPANVPAPAMGGC